MIIDLQKTISFKLGHLEFLNFFLLFSRLVGLPSRSRVFLGFVDSDNIGKILLGTDSTSGIGGLHNLDLDTEHTLLDEDMADSFIDEFLASVTGLDHVTFLELHGVSTLLTELTGDDDFATLSTSFKSRTNDSVSSTADGKTSEQLVLASFSLSFGTERSFLDAFSIEDDVVLSETESTHHYL